MTRPCATETGSHSDRPDRIEGDPNSRLRVFCIRPRRARRRRWAEAGAPPGGGARGGSIGSPSRCETAAATPEGNGGHPYPICAFATPEESAGGSGRGVGALLIGAPAPGDRTPLRDGGGARRRGRQRRRIGRQSRCDLIHRRHRRGSERCEPTVRGGGRRDLPAPSTVDRSRQSQEGKRGRHRQVVFAEDPSTCRTCRATSRAKTPQRRRRTQRERRDDKS